jgi:hypothetical protein
MVRNVATALGVEDFANAPWNLEAKVRRSLGLPIYDKWDDYRIDRALAVLEADGTYSHEEIMRAMAISAEKVRGTPREQLMEDPAWEVYQDAVKKANQTAVGGTAGALLSFVGLPVNMYPRGEQTQRYLKGGFVKALQARDAGNDQAMVEFFDAHPEYASYLSLFDKPEDRLKNFLVDQTWDRWYALPTVTQKELLDQMGPQFADKFINKDTRNVNAISLEEMQVYLKLMGGKPVGVMTADQKMLVQLFSGQLQLTKPEVAWRAQSFYEIRKSQFPDYYQQQNDYYDPGSKSYKKATPSLKQYWNWRRDFLTKNPDLVPYLTDNEKDIAKAQTQSRREGAVPLVSDIQLSPSLERLVSDARQGGELSYAAEQGLKTVATSYGLSIEQLYGMLGLQ